ncbi:dTDP-4-amino-4,6-dideoxyglucose formyltransferase [Christiangramia forsetii]|uniref:Formyltransferase family protein n=2 Tax=Christiangramia forsetii TaxID=411153 RepID=A0M302_CHRFK|nr:dTDP-4-amino-4,6-dideoxyglucose formyltransferase [Christiangramia forsetii]GGG27109.1 hypothetical protein GCM10011532_08150 [Christiangramia forsetii]CAL66997.1 formyltransferase family protein [Christiangramia forsetii KT0803]
MKRILVIIDNLQQYEKIQSLINKKNRANLNFDFYHSNVPTDIWDHIDFKNQNKILDVNQKTDWILENFHMVVSVHCYQFFPAKLVNGIRCINIHPGYNPVNRGWYPQVFSIINDLQIGATIHEMDEKLDNGPIISRKFVEKFSWDTSLTLYNRVLNAEMELLQENFDKIFDGNYLTKKPETGGNFFSKRDFKELLEINMDETDTYRNIINRLRALTHGSYKNMYYTDPESGRKVYVNLSLIPEDEKEKD